MSEPRIVSGEQAPMEGHDKALRPQTLAEFVGQEPEASTEERALQEGLPVVPGGSYESREAHGNTQNRWRGRLQEDTEPRGASFCRGR